jgi:hypothetical protein
MESTASAAMKVQRRTRFGARGAAEAFLTARINQRSSIDAVLPRLQGLSQSADPDIAGAAARILQAHKDTTTPP